MRHSLFIFFFFLCLWLLPVASFQFFLWGVPFYPVEAVLLAMIPLFSFRDIRFLQQSHLKWGIGLFVLCFLLGSALSFLFNPWTVSGLGIMKSFVFFPILFCLFALVVLQDTKLRTEVLIHLSLVFVLVSLVAVLSGSLFDRYTYDHRLRAWFQSPNLLAFFVLPGAVLWLKRMLTEEISLVRCLLALFVTGTLFLTHSYGSIGAYFLAGMTFLVVRNKPVSLWMRRVAVFIVVGIVCIGLWSAMTTLFGDTSSLSRSSLASRGMIWTVAIQMVHDHPLFGIGPGRFQTEYLAYQYLYPPYLEWAVPHPHNFFLALWLSAGFLGAVAILLLIVIVASQIRIAFGNTEKALSLALLVSFFAAGILDVPYFRAELCYLFWFEMALFVTLFSGYKYGVKVQS